MASVQSGKAGSPVSPEDPADAHEADNAKPGGVDQAYAGGSQNRSGGQGGADSSSNFKPHKADPAKTSWIEIELVDEDNNPVPGEAYSITLPDGQTVAEGTLDEKGFARVEGIDPGTCRITFSDWDKDAWEKV